MLRLVPEETPIPVGGLPYAALLDQLGLEEEPQMQVRVAPRGPWHRPAVNRSITACGKTLGAYALRDESYLDELCTDGCFSPHELGVLAPQARIEDAAERRRSERAAVDKWHEEYEVRREKERAEKAERELRRSQSGLPPPPIRAVIDDDDDD